MANMRFDVKCVKDCLVKNKIVYTVRAWQGYGVSSKVNVDSVGLCTKTRLMRVTRKEDLAQYLSLSGFSSLDDWWAKIRSFGACEGWLFEVRVIPASPSLAPKEDVMRIAFTYHRHLKYKDVAPVLEKLHKRFPDTIWITGGAVGLGSRAAKSLSPHTHK